MILEYKISSTQDRDYIADLRDFFDNYDDVELKQIGIKTAAIDLISSLSVVGLYLFLKILDPFVSGVINEDYFKSLGLKLHKTIASSKEKKKEILNSKIFFLLGLLLTHLLMQKHKLLTMKNIQ